MKVIAYYLPQFHEIPENNAWWGDGFTEWTNMKKAKPLFQGHNQPRIPLNHNYYDLLDTDVQRWQVGLAKKYGIYGFCFYHYWFNGKKLLEKPVENYLQNADLDLSFCISWANEAWTNAWEGSDLRVLIEQKYGEKQQWKEHFEYLLPYFKDSRYIKVDGKPLFVIYRPDIMEHMEEMLTYWRELAKENGIGDICYAYQHHKYYFYNNISSIFDFGIEYQPGFAQLAQDTGVRKVIRKFALKIGGFSEKYLKGKLNLSRAGVQKLNYDEIWSTILSYEHNTEKMIPGAFVDWDNTPRRGEKGSLMLGTSPVKFEKYFEQQVISAKNNYHKDMMFMFAWNEWAEGGYLEPDEKYQYAYLEAIENVLRRNNEFPEEL